MFSIQVTVARSVERETSNRKMKGSSLGSGVGTLSKKLKFTFLLRKASVLIMFEVHRRTEYSVRVRNIPCGCRIFRAGAKYSVQPLAVSALPLALFRRAPSIFRIALNLIPIVSGDSKPLRRDWSQQEIFLRTRWF